MKCLKIQHQVQIYSLCAFLFSCLFCVFGLSQDSFATSLDCTFDGNGSFSQCSNFNISDYKYFKFKHVLLKIQVNVNDPNNFQNYQIYLNSNPTSAVYIRYKKIPGLQTIDLDIDSIWLPLGVQQVMSDGSSSSLTYPASGFSTWPGNNVSTVSYKFDVTFYDDIPSTPSEPCPVCPELPENPYDNKLDDIKKAIYSVGASLFVLYFFFCIYKIIVKDGGSR